MSAPALRRPARWHHALRAELAVLTGPRMYRWLAAAAFIGLTSATSYDSGEGPFSEMRMVGTLMFFLPLAQWPGGVRPRIRRTPLPIRSLRLEMIRTACGAAWALVVLAGAVGVYAAVLSRSGEIIEGLPPAYPVSLCLMGLANYLVGSAVAARSNRPGRVMLGVFALAAIILGRTGIWVESWEFSSHYVLGIGRYVGTASTDLTLASSLFRVGIATAVVWLSAVLGDFGRGWGLARYRAALADRLLALPRSRRGLAPAHGSEPRRPPHWRTVFGRQVGVLGPRMPACMLLLVVLTCMVVRSELTEEATATTSRFDGDTMAILIVLGYFWPLLVWLNENEARPWDEAKPVGSFQYRLLHFGAGLAWLQAACFLMLAAALGTAAAMGELDSVTGIPAWVLPGIPLSLAALYCLGSVPVMLGEPPAGVSLFGFMFLIPILAMIEFAMYGSIDFPHPPLSPSRAFAPLGMVSPSEWSVASALLWYPPCVAAAVLAIYVRVRGVRVLLWSARRETAKAGAPPIP